MRNQKERGGVVARVLIALAVLLGCGLMILVATGIYIAKNVHVAESRERGETRVETPFGSVRVKERSRLDPKNFGIPVYPGAERVDDSRKLASFELDFGDLQKDVTIAVAEYVTSDTLRQVESFYRERLHDARVKRGRHERIVFETGQGPGKNVVAIRERDGRTYISLASIADGAAN